MAFRNKNLNNAKILLLILLILIPVNIFLTLLTPNTKIIEKTNSEKEEDQEIIETPKPAAVYDFGYDIKINGSTIYPNGTWYLFREDYLYFEVINRSIFSDVRLICDELIIDQQFDEYTEEWNWTEYFDDSEGSYDAIIRITNNSIEIDFPFTLDITVPGPQIIDVQASDTTFNPTPRSLRSI